MLEKKKNSSETMNRWLFVALWAGIHAITYGTMTGLYNFLTAPFEHNEYLIFIVGGILPGITLSIPTYWLIKRFRGISIRWWRPASFVAWLIGAFWFLYLYSISFPLMQTIFWFIPVYLVQAWLLRKYVKQSWLWILAGMTSAILFIFAGAENERAFTWAFSGGLQGLLSALILLALFTMQKEEKSKMQTTYDYLSTQRLRDSIEDADYQAEDAIHSKSRQSS